MEEEERANLFKALNDVKNLMQQDNIDDLDYDTPQKAAPLMNANVLELAGLEIHDFDEELSQTNQEEQFNITEISIGTLDDLTSSETEEELDKPSISLEESLDADILMEEIFSNKDSKMLPEFGVDFTQIVRDIAKPHILEWLNNNLERMVREAVESEIAMIMRKSKK